MAARKRKKLQGSSLTGNAHLADSCISLLQIRDHTRRQLGKILDEVPGRRACVFDESLFGPLGCVVPGSLFKDHACDKMDKLREEEIKTSYESIIYLVRPLMKNAKWIAKHIKEHRRSLQSKKYYLVFVPRSATLCERLLKTEGVFGECTIKELPLQIIPLDKDVITHCHQDSFRELYLEGDTTVLFDVATSLLRLQHLFGLTPEVHVKGDMAWRVVSIMERMRREQPNVYSCDSANPVITKLILLDRNVDMITPLLTPRTYEGLLDYVYGIKNCTIELVDTKDATKEASKPEKAKPKKMCLNSSDLIFKHVRDVNFDALSSIFKQMASRIKQGYDKRHGMDSISEINSFMKQFKGLRQDHDLLEKHINLADKIAAQHIRGPHFQRIARHEYSLLSGIAHPTGESAEDFVEECIGRMRPLALVLRLLGLITLTVGGISASKFQSLKRDILQTYGYQHIFTLMSMERHGLLRKLEGFKRFVQNTSAYANLKRSLNLICDGDSMDMSNPGRLGANDINCVGSGYAPLSVRLVEAATKPNGWRTMESEMSELPGRFIPLYLQRNPEDDEKAHHAEHQKTQSQTNPKAKVALVVFIGGVTFAEISAIRMLERRDSNQWRFIVLTTDMLKGGKFMENFLSKIVDKQLLF